MPPIVILPPDETKQRTGKMNSIATIAVNTKY